MTFGRRAIHRAERRQWPHGPAPGPSPPPICARRGRWSARRPTHTTRGRDGTKYSKFHPENYLSHHLAAISMAAVYADACHIDDGVTGLKQDALRASSSPDEE